MLGHDRGASGRDHRHPWCVIDLESSIRERDRPTSCPSARRWPILAPHGSCRWPRARCPVLVRLESASCSTRAIRRGAALRLDVALTRSSNGRRRSSSRARRRSTPYRTAADDEPARSDAGVVDALATTSTRRSHCRGCRHRGSRPGPARRAALLGCSARAPSLVRGGHSGSMRWSPPAREPAAPRLRRAPPHPRRAAGRGSCRGRRAIPDLARAEAVRNFP